MDHFAAGDGGIGLRFLLMGQYSARLGQRTATNVLPALFDVMVDAVCVQGYRCTCRAPFTLGESTAGSRDRERWQQLKRAFRSMR